MPISPDPFRVDVTIPLALTTIVDTTYRQVDEDEFAPDAPVTVLDLIIAQAARQLLAETDAEQRRELRGIVRDRYIALIDEALTPIIAEALAAPIQPTNSYGEPAGKPTTLRQLVIDRVGQCLTARTGDNYDRTVLGDALKAVTDSVIRQEMADTIADAKAQVRGQLAAVTAEAIARVIAR